MASVAWAEKVKLGGEDGAHLHAKCFGQSFQNGARRAVCADRSDLAMHIEVADDISFGDSDQSGIMWEAGMEGLALWCREGSCPGTGRGGASTLACAAGAGAARAAARAPAAAPPPGAALAEAAPAGHAAGAPRAEEEELELTVLSLSGVQLAQLACLRGDVVSEVKRRLARAAGAAASEQRLVHGQAVLRDEETLLQGGVQGPRATLQCVCVRPSAVARNLEAQRLANDPAQALGACLADVADSVMQSEHALSERMRPSAADVTRPIAPRHRGELINWMVQAFDVLRFDDSMLHSVVLTLDRYYAARGAPIEVAGIQRVLLSAVCTEMKLASEAEFPEGHRQRVLSHLCHGRLSMASILRTEHELLARLGFVVGVPTPVTFLRELEVHLRELAPAAECERALQLALFLLELALYEPELQYARPHAVLAVAALGAALRTLGAPAEQHEALLEDLATYCPGLEGAEQLVPGAEEALLELWLACATGAGRWGDFYAQLEGKFSWRARHAVATESPRAGLERVRGRPGARCTARRGREAAAAPGAAAC